MPLQNLNDVQLESSRKIAIMGESGSGKTHKLIEAMTWAASQVETPEQLKIAFIDCDDGIRKLIGRGLLQEEIRGRILYSLYYQDWNGIRDDTKSILGDLKDNARDHGPNSTWLIVDNLAKVWDWLHEDYCVDVYGMTRKEMMRDARKRAMDEGKKALPVLNQMLDYGVLNAEFFGWWDTVQFTDINMLVTSPAWLTRSQEDRSEITDVNMKGVNPEVIHRLDEVFWIHQPDNVTSETRVSSLIKRRTCSKKFSNVPDLSFTQWMNWVKKYALEKPLEIAV